MYRYLTLLSRALTRSSALMHAGLVLAALTVLPEVARAESGPVVPGADALHKAAKRGSGGGKSAPRRGGGASSGSKPAADSKPASKPAADSKPASKQGQDASPRASSSQVESRSGPAQQATTRGPQPVSGSRVVDFGNPGSVGARPGAAVGPSGHAGSGSGAPANFRGGTPVSREQADQGHTQRRGDSSRGGHRPATATAQDHRDAGRAGHATAAHRAGRHGAATSRSASYRRSYSAARRHYSWYQPRGWFVRWQPGRAHHWYHGVFVYGPPPGSPPPPAGHPRANLPERRADHAGDLSLGVRAGTLGSGYLDAPGYSDFGLGLAARYRLNDPLGIEVQWLYHDASWQKGTERIEQPFSASLELFAVPWAKVNPYLLGGVSVTKRNFQDRTAGGFVDTEAAVWGPHLGLGVEFNLGKSTSLSFDGRYLSYLNLAPDDSSRRGALQGNMGLNFYF